MKKMKQLLDKFDAESNEINKILLSKTIFLYYFSLSEKEQEYFDERVELGDDFSMPYFLREDTTDRVYCDGNILKYIYCLLVDIYAKSGFKYYDLFPTNKISKKEQEEIISEVLNDIGSDCFKLYKDLKQNNRIKSKIMDDDFTGFCLFGYGLVPDEIYINEMLGRTILSITTMCHEIGHIYEKKLLRDSPWFHKVSYANVFGEVMSSYFERRTLEYMIRNKIYEEDCQKALNREYFKLINSFTKFDDFLYDKHFKNQDDISMFDYRYFAEFGGKVEVPIKDIIYSSGDLEYGIGFLLGEKFLIMDDEYQGEGFGKIQDFLSKQLIVPDRKLLESIDFFDDDFRLLEKSLKKNNSYMRKRFKK